MVNTLGSVPAEAESGHNTYCGDQGSEEGAEFVAITTGLPGLQVGPSALIALDNLDQHPFWGLQDFNIVGVVYKTSIFADPLVERYDFASGVSFSTLLDNASGRIND